MIAKIPPRYEKKFVVPCARGIHYEFHPAKT